MAMSLGNPYSITTLSQIGTFVIFQRNPEMHHVQKCTCIRFQNPGQAPAISDDQPLLCHHNTNILNNNNIKESFGELLI